MPVDERVARSVALEQAYVHDVYEQFYDNTKSKPWPRVEDFLNDLEPGSLVCDVGCGDGKYLNVNTSIFNIGAEKSTRLSEVAHENNNEVIVLDNLALPFKDESLDAVVSIAVVHHFATTDRRICALKELARVLRIGGRIIISVWAMEQSHRKFESQDVLVPWRRPRHISTPSLELTSTTTNSEDDGLPAYHAYTQSDTDSTRSNRSKAPVRRKGHSRKGRSIDPGHNSSPSSSSLSSPNETCYSFVRRALQKLTGGTRRVAVHKPWFLESWTTCAKETPPKRCSDCCENIQDIPIELRRIDEDDMPQRRQTFPASLLINEITHLKSKSMTNIKTADNNHTNITSEIPEEETINEQEESVKEESDKSSSSSAKNTLNKPKLVKQKKSICEDDADEALDQPTDMKKITTLPELKSALSRNNRAGVLKQRSMNEELMSTERLQEKERLRQNIQKQASLNEELIYQRTHAFDTFKDSVFYVSTSKKFQLIKTGFTNKIKNSTTNIEKVTGASLKNGFVRMFQNWKTSDIISPSIPENEPVDNVKTPIPTFEDKKETNGSCERRHSKEDGSDSSKDSSLQSDTSVDSEDSFASVIFVPKSNPLSPTNLSPGPTSPRMIISSVPNSPRIKQGSSCPTSPRIKQMPLAIYPLTKQLSSPKPTTETFADKLESRDHANADSTIKEPPKMPKQKYTVPPIPQFKKTNQEKSATCTDAVLTTANTTVTTLPAVAPTVVVTSTVTPVVSSKSDNVTNTTPSVNPTPVLSTTPPSPEKSPLDTPESRNDRLKEIKELLSRKPGFGRRNLNSKPCFPIVRQYSVSNGKVEAVAKPLPKLMTLELFNPETDDRDSDSSTVSSPDSVDSVISVSSGRRSPGSNTKFKFPPVSKTEEPRKSLLEAAAEVANSLDEAVDKVIRSSPRAKKRLQAGEVLSILQRSYSTDTEPLLEDDSLSTWDDDCQKHLTDFADKLSEKLLREIDQYEVKTRLGNTMDNYNDPYINRLSEELNDLSKLSAEIRKHNEYLAKLSIRDSLLTKACFECKKNCECECFRTKNKNTNNLIKGDNDSLESSGGVVGKEEDVSRDGSNSVVKCDIKCSDNVGDVEPALYSSLCISTTSIKMGTSSDSCDSEKGSSSNSTMSSTATSINFGPSIESNDGLSVSESHKDANSISRYGSDGGSTTSLASCPEWKTIKDRSRSESGIEKDVSSVSLDSGCSKSSKSRRDKSVPSDISQDSLPTDNIGGEITYHRYYHVFREGELDQLIEKYVENLHIISSYYDHASWCIIAEKVQVWTI